MFGILLDLAGAVLSGKDAGEQMRESDRRKQKAISESNKATLGRVAGIAAFGAVAALGINKLAEDKKNSGKRA
ncbi:MAG: hypothetical protein IJ685_13145 [Selenomonadaceae bacterium]|nr:hypothetical protein [Selenomonadaceae bacterium]